MSENTIISETQHPDPNLFDIANRLVSQHAALQQYQNLFDLWTKSSTNRRSTTIDEYSKVFLSFAQFVGRKPLASVARRDIVDFRDHLLSAGQSASTANRKVGILRTIFLTGLNYELLDINPTDNVRTQTAQGHKNRLAFTPDDLHRIFTSDIYTAEYRPIGGGREACFWLPLLALFTGARVEELAQLLVADIHFVENLGHYLNITDEAEHSQLKNSASRRRIPLHPVLIACGFLDYAESIKPNRFLFPHLKPNPRNKLAGYFSNFFSKYLRQTIKITDNRKVFHSFRHTFKDVCRSVGIEESVHDALTGHTNSSAGRKYGNELYPLEPLFEAIERYDIPELDLSYLYTRPPVFKQQRSDVKLLTAYYGIVISFATTKSRKKIAPFVLVHYQGDQAGIDIGSNKVIFGSIPFAKQILAQAWIEIHREELIASWEMGKMTGEYLRVDPLR